MEIINDIATLRKRIKELKRRGKTIGLVPTMGFLHEGHESLLRKCREDNDIAVTSNFVNPTQFAPNEDLATYPRNFEKDAKICEDIGIDIIFHPEPSEMYHDPCTYVNIEKLSTNLCGKSRPIHFRGVCTVVSKLFNIVTPDRAYFGQKDAQQLAIIKKMVEDLNFDVEIIGCPIIREKDGLAKSSRNEYLNDDERISALILSKALNKAKEIIKKDMTSHEIIKVIEDMIKTEKRAKIDYIEIVNIKDMQKVEKIDRTVLVAIAVFIGKIRLIDNFIFEL